MTVNQEWFAHIVMVMIQKMEAGPGGIDSRYPEGGGGGGGYMISIVVRRE